MKINKFVKKHRDLFIKYVNTIEKVWDMVYNIPAIGPHICYDFYPYRGRGSAFKWYQIFTWRYLRYSSLTHDIVCTISDWTETIVEKIQCFLIGKRNKKKLDMLLCCNDSKLLTSNGWSCEVRNREEVTKYYRLHAYPFGYFTIYEDMYGDGVNLYMHGTLLMLGDETQENVSIDKTTRIIFSGWANNLSSVMRMARAYCMAYEGKRNFYTTTVEYRNEMREWRNEND